MGKDLFDFEDFFTGMKQEFEKFLTQQDPQQVTGLRTPLSNIEEHTKHFLITVELPGIKKENISLSFHEGALDIEATQELEKKKNAKYKQHYEFTTRSFRRRFSLDPQADVSKVKAEYIDGVLTIMLPKKKLSTSKIKHIKIK